MVVVSGCGRQAPLGWVSYRRALVCIGENAVIGDAPPLRVHGRKNIVLQESGELEVRRG